MDIKDLHRRSLDDLGARIARVKPADLSAVTPCAGWDLRDLLGHLIAENRGFVSAARGAGVWTDGDLGDDPAATFTATAAEVVRAFADPGFLQRTVTVGEFGAFPGGVAIRMHFVDNLAHAWDVARALRIPWDPAPDLVEAALEIALAFPLTRGPGEAFAAAVPLPATAAAADRFLAHLGRDPLTY